MSEGKEWLKSIIYEVGSVKLEERNSCPFDPDYITPKKCWLKASPQVCHLCLMGKLIDMLSEKLSSIDSGIWATE